MSQKITLVSLFTESPFEPTIGCFCTPALVSFNTASTIIGDVTIIGKEMGCEITVIQSSTGTVFRLTKSSLFANILFRNTARTSPEASRVHVVSTWIALC